VAATLITYANPLVDQWVASLAGPGAPSLLGYANRLITGVVGLVAGVASQVLLIRFSSQVAANDRVALSATYRLVVRGMAWVGCFATLAIWLSSDLLVSLLYERGSFDAAATAAVADLLDRYALQLPVFWAGIAGGTLIWALSLNRVLVRIGVALFVTNLVLDLLLLELLGVRGIPLTTTAVLTLSVVLVNRAVQASGRLEVRARDWLMALVPVVLLVVAGVVISRTGIAFGPSLEAGNIGLPLSVAVAFACLALVAVRRELSAYRVAVAAREGGDAPHGEHS
jgi:peptidoglycan biosynthesis protein MviN/MurJ (putative lipid II flippase)